MPRGRQSPDRSRPDQHLEVPTARWLQDGLGHVKELSERVTELSTLMGVSALISSQLPLSEVLDQVCRLTAEICKADVAFVFLSDGDDDLVCLTRHVREDLVGYAWEGAARMYGRRAVGTGRMASRSSLLLRAQPATGGRARMGGICAVPLKGKARVVGALAIGYVGVHRFSAREKDMLNAVSAQLAMAVERSWLFDRLQEQLARANSLREVTNRIGSNLRLDLVLDSVVDHASKLLAAEFSAIFLVGEPDGLTPQPGRPAGERAEAPEPAVRRDESPLERAVRQAVETGSVSIAHSSPPKDRQESAAEPRANEYRVALAVPLLSGKDVLGALALCYAERRHFDDSDITLAKDFAGQAALAIRNARLYEDAMRDRLFLEAAINQITNHGISLLDGDLNIRFANPATFWLLGVRPRKGTISMPEWTTLVKRRGLLKRARLDELMRRIREHPEQTIEVTLSPRSRAETGRTVRLLSLPLRQPDGSVRGRVNLLEED